MFSQPRLNTFISTKVTHIYTVQKVDFNLSSLSLPFLFMLYERGPPLSSFLFSRPSPHPLSAIWLGGFSAYEDKEGERGTASSFHSHGRPPAPTSFCCEGPVWIGALHKFGRRRRESWAAHRERERGERGTKPLNREGTNLISPVFSLPRSIASCLFLSNTPG